MRPAAGGLEHRWLQVTSPCACHLTTHQILAAWSIDSFSLDVQEMLEPGRVETVVPSRI